MSGHPVMAVGEHAVVLPDGVRHFRPLVHCSRCGERFVAFWSPVLRRADLENPPANRMCEKCTRAMVQ